ncbi:MAG: hypothetical protein BMS9Abin12_1950 [Acidimicrobiia bacterium]|nr:MAG: hypothetical protein BMS9Abin12_1950 [Acidimicrobiia bacterium]
MATEPIEELPEDIDLDVEDDGPGEVVPDVVDAQDDDGGAAAEALDELEAEELEMLTDDESDETLVVDEAAEMRAIRRAEIALQDDSVDEASADEFVCSSCFLVKRTSQLANKRKKICLDCAP